MAVGETVTPMRSSRLVKLCAEKTVCWRVALAGQTDHQSIANQVVIADALDTGEILQARGARPSGATAEQQAKAVGMDRSLFIGILDGQNAHQPAVQNEGTPDRVAHHAFAVHLNFELRQVAGENRIVGQVGRTRNAAHGNHLFFGIDLNLFGGFEYQISVGKNVGHARGEHGRDGGGAGGGSGSREVLAELAPSKFASAPVGRFYARELSDIGRQAGCCGWRPDCRPTPLKYFQLLEWRPDR